MRSLPQPLTCSFLVFFILAGCEAETVAVIDNSRDVIVDDTRDVTVDDTRDVTVDDPRDATVDVSNDVIAEVLPFDGTTRPDVRVSPDVTPDVAPDVVVDVPFDSVRDVASDVTTELPEVTLPCDSGFVIAGTRVANAPLTVRFSHPTGFTWVALDVSGPGTSTVGPVTVMGGSPNTWTYPLVVSTPGVWTVSFVQGRMGGARGTIVASCSFRVAPGPVVLDASVDTPLPFDPNDYGERAGAADPCAPIPAQSYGVTSTTSHAREAFDAPRWRGTNVLLYGRRDPGSSELRFVSIPGPEDPSGQQPTFRTLFTDRRVPSLAAVRFLLEYPGGPDVNAGVPWPAVLLAFASVQGEVLACPESGPLRQIAPDGSRAMVLYATDRTITLRYGNDDAIGPAGYTIHIDGVCVEPSLRRLYEANATTRHNLPRLRASEPFGRARGSRVWVSLRDSGQFMDVRDNHGGSGGWYRPP